MSKMHPPFVATNIKPIDLKSLPLDELCVVEAMYEEIEKGLSEGRDWVCTTRKAVNAKIREKKRELKKTGRVSTIVPPGTFNTANVKIDNKYHKSLIFSKNGEHNVLMDDN